MPWEKNFDIDEALDSAALVFSKKGFEATSIADLVNGMGINRGSLYATFGNKHALYKTVLTRFVEKNQAQTLAALRAINDPVAAISALFEAVLTQSVRGREMKGNLIITTAMEFPSHEEDIQAIAKSALDALEAFFHEMIEAGKALSDIPQSTDTDRAAKSLVAMTVGFRVLARGAYDADALRVGTPSALSIIGL